MLLFEHTKVNEVNAEDFEDVTDQIFYCVDNHLQDIELMANPNFNWEETMSSFELMDLKMDLRMQRNKTKQTHKDLLAQLDRGELQPFSQQRKLSLMRELLL